MSVSCHGMMLPLASIWSGQSAVFALTSVTGVAGATGGAGSVVAICSATGASLTAAASGAEASAYEKFTAPSASTACRTKERMRKARFVR